MFYKVGFASVLLIMVHCLPAWADCTADMNSLVDRLNSNLSRTVQLNARDPENAYNCPNVLPVEYERRSLINQYIGAAKRCGKSERLSFANEQLKAATTAIESCEELVRRTEQRKREASRKEQGTKGDAAANQCVEEIAGRKSMGYANFTLKNVCSKKVTFDYDDCSQTANLQVSCATKTLSLTGRSTIDIQNYRQSVNVRNIR